MSTPLSRRGFVGCLAGAIVAPMIVRPTSIMRIKQVEWWPDAPAGFQTAAVDLANYLDALRTAGWSVDRDHVAAWPLIWAVDRDYADLLADHDWLVTTFPVPPEWHVLRDL